MPQVEVFGKDELKPLFVANFDFLPRIGDTVSKDVGGYFSYHKVVEIWHREQEGELGTFRTCIQVELDD
jgi:hypothetical protein